VRVKAAGVCLSDVHLANGQIKPTYRSGGKVIIGHEVSGIVDATGPDVDGWSGGDRVILYPIIDRADGPRIQGVDYDGGWERRACPR
jgi:D-arabinose 1-dehydrogenase-like Zn-dependent alcohol dehydrogenase